MDLVVRCQDLPVAGQTVLSQSSSECCGGKGANQAVAASLAGGDVSMIGAVGGDAFADRLINNLIKYGVNFESVTRLQNQASGLAVIAVDSTGQNSIMVVPNANASVTPEIVRAAEPVIKRSDCLMMQLEIPIESVLEGIRIARQHGVPTILDPAPVPDEFPPTLLDVDFLCPNETEAAEISGLPVTTIEQAKTAAIRLQEMGARIVAITMGAQGTVLCESGSVTAIPALTVDTVDTTAAGDSFAGALVVRLTQDDTLHDAVVFANNAGSIAASRAGAQDSIPTYKQILKFGRQKS